MAVLRGACVWCPNSVRIYTICIAQGGGWSSEGQRSGCCLAAFQASRDAALGPPLSTRRKHPVFAGCLFKDMPQKRVPQGLSLGFVQARIFQRKGRVLAVGLTRIVLLSRRDTLLVVRRFADDREQSLEAKALLVNAPRRDRIHVARSSSPWYLSEGSAPAGLQL